jgi:branched-chain amino acid transport system substrate-binding protein
MINRRSRAHRIGRACGAPPGWTYPLILLVTLLASPLAKAQTSAARIAVVMARTGPDIPGGRPALDAVQLAVDEANATGETPRIELEPYDDRSSGEGAREAARQIVAGDALVVVGPGTTASALAAAPLLAEASIPSLLPYAHGGGGESNPTAFRLVFSTTDIGEALANNLRHVLGATRAVVIFHDDGYSRPVAEGFRRAAGRLGIAAACHAYTTTAESVEVARLAAAEPEPPAIVFALPAKDTTPVLAALRRQGAKSLLLGTDSIANDAFADGFAQEPESRQDPGFFTDGLYAISPLIFDSANAETLAFAARFRARFGSDLPWHAAQGYDAARLAIAAVRAATRQATASDVRTRRAAVLAYLRSLDGPSHAVESLTGPLWFTAERGRQQPARFGRFHGTRFESAPVQLVPVTAPTSAEIASGALVDLGSGRYARRQQVAYTGVFLNEIPRVDIAQSTFTADFYLWMRFAPGVGAGAADPGDIDFPDLVGGSFDPKRPAEQSDLGDGTTYRLWHVRGDFKNDFDLHHYPLDRQRLTLRLFNARAASDRVVYVQDRRSLRADAGRVRPDEGAREGGAAADALAQEDDRRHGGTIAPAAFRNLTQWEALTSIQRRDTLVTESALGNPRLMGVERVRELSGYRLEVELARRTLPALTKTLLPLGIMGLIMLGSLWIPHGLVGYRITVAVTAALSGAVLLSAVNSQLGAVGYTMAVEYVFYLFFLLCLLAFVAVLAAEHLRVAKRGVAAARTERLTRGLFLVAMIGTAVATMVAARYW